MIDDGLRAVDKDVPLDPVDAASFVGSFDHLPINLFAENMQANVSRTDYPD